MKTIFDELHEAAEKLSVTTTRADQTTLAAILRYVKAQPWSRLPSNVSPKDVDRATIVTADDVKKAHEILEDFMGFPPQLSHDLTSRLLYLRAYVLGLRER